MSYEKENFSWSINCCYLFFVRVDLFASSTSTVPNSSPSANEVVAAGEYYQAILNLKVGEAMWVTGYDFWYIHTDGSIEVRQDGLITALSPGASTVAADFGNGNTMYYIVLVK